MVTVVICTRNRASRLRAALATVIDAARLWRNGIEVVVVDNGSQDATRSMLLDLSNRHACIRVVHDPLPGRSGALNRVLPQVRGHVMLFTDDDVHVPASWVYDMAGPILSGKCDAVAGKVILADCLARGWLTSELRTALAELLDVSGDLPGMVGANMAASTVAARAIGFDESLGPGARGFGDDVLFNLKLKAEGWRICGSEGPPVVHHLDPHRLTRAAMLDLARQNGQSHAFLWHHWLHTGLKFLALRRWRNDLRVARYRIGHTARSDMVAQREYDLVYSGAFIKALMAERGNVPRYDVAPAAGAPDTPVT